MEEETPPKMQFQVCIVMVKNERSSCFPKNTFRTFQEAVFGKTRGLVSAAWIHRDGCYQGDAEQHS